MNRMFAAAAAALTLCAAASAQNAATQFDFTSGNLDPTFGNGFLYFFDGRTEQQTQFGTASSFGLPAMAGGDANVMFFPQAIDSAMGFVLEHGAPANGGGEYVNEYTIVMDLLIPQDIWDTQGYLSFYNTNDSNSNDGDLFLDFSDGSIGISGVYQGQVRPNTWHRVAFTVKLDDNQQPVLRKYIDGILVGRQDLDGLDGRWSLYTVDQDTPWIFLLTDNDAETSGGYVSSIYFVDRAMTSGEIRALNCPNAAGVTTAGPDCGDQDAFCESPADINGDGRIDGGDFLEYLSAFFAGCKG